MGETEVVWDYRRNGVVTPSRNPCCGSSLRGSGCNPATFPTTDHPVSACGTLVDHIECCEAGINRMTCNPSVAPLARR
ncbi:MAG: hypothetical protein AB8I08_36255 [Sandaracinaceae bacterium]